jgi:SAM-dependent methyltransferase
MMWKKILLAFGFVTAGVGLGFLWKSRRRWEKEVKRNPDLLRWGACWKKIDRTTTCPIWNPTPQQSEFAYHLKKVRNLYQIDTALLPERLNAVWMQASLDTETEAWLESKARRGLRSALFMYYFQFGISLLTELNFSRTDVSAMLGLDMYVFSQEILRKLLPAEFKPKLMLDIGAGSGSETHKAKEVWGLPPDSVYTIEVSQYMIGALQRRGFHTVTVADFNRASYALKFDFIMCLNVLDRVDDPSSFLTVLTKRMAPDGYLMLALALPFCDGVEDGPNFRTPKRPLKGMLRQCRTTKIENGLVAFVERVLPNFNLEVVAATKVPYISMGDLAQSWYTESDVLLVCKLKAGRLNEADYISPNLTRPAEDAVQAEL